MKIKTQEVQSIIATFANGKTPEEKALLKELETIFQSGNRIARFLDMAEHVRDSARTQLRVHKGDQS